MKITRGKIPCAKKVVCYGPEGIGKSTFASQFPDPVFIDTEGSTKDLDVARTPAPSSWSMLMEQVRYIREHPETCKTLVIDTADWAEQICASHICDKYQKSGIEDFGYGKGYIFLQEEFGRLLNLLTELVEQKGIHVVLNAHAKMRKFEQPDEMGAYDRWEMKMSKNVAPMVKEWADMVLFANYKTHVVKIDGKNKAQGGQRVMYTAHHSCWDAKNRYGLPEEIPFAYEAIAHIIGDCRIETNKEAPVDVQPDQGERQQEGGKTTRPEREMERAETAHAVSAGGQPDAGRLRTDPGGKQTKETESRLDPRIPKNLRELMEANHVCAWDLQNVVEAKGYVPAETPIWDYDSVNPGIVDGLLVASWDQVYAAIQEMKEKQEIPFD